jgi:hypothetical protein
MERPEPVTPVEEQLADGTEGDLPPITHERRSTWGDRRQEPEER